MTAFKRDTRRTTRRTSWDAVADWYNGWMGVGGSNHHRRLAVPAVLELLSPRARESILDIGAGQGVLAPYIAQAKARYTGVDASPRLLDYARRHHGRAGKFLLGDACRLAELPDLRSGVFDAVVFLLSLQNMEPLDDVLCAAAWALRPGGRLVALITHPCFRIPMQSGWGWDEGRKLQYRRIDRYLTPLYVPLPVSTGEKNHIVPNFHRPLEDYINKLAECGLLVDRLKEIPASQALSAGRRAKADSLANREIPLFLGLSARKLESETRSNPSVST